MWISEIVECYEAEKKQNEENVKEMKAKMSTMENEIQNQKANKEATNERERAEREVKIKSKFIVKLLYEKILNKRL